MPKQLLDPHFISTVLFILVVSIGWFIKLVPTETALPLLAISAGIGVGANAMLKGITTGIPLSPSGGPPA